MCDLRKLGHDPTVNNVIAAGLVEENERWCQHGHHWVCRFDKTFYFAWTGQCPDSIPIMTDSGPTFESFRQEFQREAFKKAVNFSNAFRKEHRRDCIFAGGTGLGKTHLARAVMAFLRSKHHAVEFIQASGLSRVFLERESWNDDWQTRQDAKEKRVRLANCDLLIVDDLGSERVTKSDHFKQCFQEFWDERKGSWLVTTNLSLSDIRDPNRYGEKIHSRLVQYADLIQFSGRDFRTGAA